MSAVNHNFGGGPENARQFGRGDVQIYADVRERGAGKYKVHIVDLSRSGFRISTSSHLRDDREIFLTIPGYAPLEARIAWHRGHEYGCEFTTHLHEAIYEHIINTHPSLAQGA